MAFKPKARLLWDVRGFCTSLVESHSIKRINEKLKYVEDNLERKCSDQMTRGLRLYHHGFPTFNFPISKMRKIIADLNKTKD
jgi:hypothetical protein